MRNLIQKNIKGWNVLLLFLLTNIIYLIMLTISIPLVMHFSGGMKLLDMLPTGYNPEYVDSLLINLGKEGREAYLYRQLPLDMIYPFLFGVGYCLLSAYVLKQLNKLNGKLFYLTFLPLFSGLFDYCENIGIVTILKTFPYNSDLMTEVTSIFSILKSFCTTLFFLLLITLLIMLGVKTVIKKWKERT